MKYIGAFLVFSACAGAGAYKALLIKSSIRTLQGLIAAFELMRGEICQTLKPLPEIFQALWEGGNSQTRPFFRRILSQMDKLGERPFSAIWRSSAGEALGVLREDELNCVLTLGEALGKYDAELQEKAIDSALGVLRAALAQAASIGGIGIKTSVGVGVCMGLMLLITFI